MLQAQCSMNAQPPNRHIYIYFVSIESFVLLMRCCIRIKWPSEWLIASSAFCSSVLLSIFYHPSSLFVFHFHWPLITFITASLMLTFDFFFVRWKLVGGMKENALCFNTKKNVTFSTLNSIKSLVSNSLRDWFQNRLDWFQNRLIDFIICETIVSTKKKN